MSNFVVYFLVHYYFHVASNLLSRMDFCLKTETVFGPNRAHRPPTSTLTTFATPYLKGPRRSSNDHRCWFTFIVTNLPKRHLRRMTWPLLDDATLLQLAPFFSIRDAPSTCVFPLQNLLLTDDFNYGSKLLHGSSAAYNSARHLL